MPVFNGVRNKDPADGLTAVSFSRFSSTFWLNYKVSIVLKANARGCDNKTKNRTSNNNKTHTHAATTVISYTTAFTL